MRTIKILISILILLFSNLTIAQGTGESNNGRIENDFKFLPIPYINYNRSIGFQLGAVPMAQFNPVSKDTLSPSSIAGLFGMQSEYRWNLKDSKFGFVGFLGIATVFKALNEDL